jgi:hypothetical protein
MALFNIAGYGHLSDDAKMNILTCIGVTPLALFIIALYYER